MMKRVIKILLALLLVAAAIPVARETLSCWRAQKEEQDLFEE